jgi:hypothetical protein
MLVSLLLMFLVLIVVEFVPRGECTVDVPGKLLVILDNNEFKAFEQTR